MIAGMGNALDRERERERERLRREKRGTVMLYQELSKGSNQTLSLLQSAGATTNTSPTNPHSANFLSPTKSPRGTKGDTSPRTKPEKSPRGSTIKRVLKLTQSLTGSHNEDKSSDNRVERGLSQSAGESSPTSPNAPNASNPQWRHSVAFFSEMGNGFERMVEEQRSMETKGWVGKAAASPRYRNPDDLERRYKKVAREEEESLELRRARDRVRAKLRAKIADRLGKPGGGAKAADRRPPVTRDEEEEWEKDSSNEAEGSTDDDDEGDSDDEGVATEDSAELELYSHLRRGMEQQQLHISHSMPTVEVSSSSRTVETRRSSNASATEDEPADRVLPDGALVNRGRSATMEFFNIMHQGVKQIVPTTEEPKSESEAKNEDQKNEDQKIVNEKPQEEKKNEDHDDEEREKRAAYKRWGEGCEARLELVHDVIRLKSPDGEPTVDIFGGPVALPIAAASLILALSCASPKDVGLLHLVAPSWTRFLTVHEAGEAVWALWYKLHFGGGPFVTCNLREYPVSWRAIYQKEWVSLKCRQRGDSRSDDPAYNMLLHFIYRGHVVLVRELLDGREDATALVNRGSALTTPLHAACQVGSLPIVRELVAHGARINARVGPEAVRLTPFYLACMHGHLAIVEYFFAHHYHAEQRDKLDARTNANADFATPVLLAAMNGYCALLRVLLEHGADPNRANANGELPLFVVVRRCGFLPPRTVREAGSEGVLERERKRRCNVAMLRHLLAHGADPVAPRTPKTEQTVIGVAIEYGCGDDVLSLLRQHGAS